MWISWSRDSVSPQYMPAAVVTYCCHILTWVINHGGRCMPTAGETAFSQPQCRWVIMKSGCQLPELLNYLSFHIQTLFSFFKVTLSFSGSKITQALSSPPLFLFRDFKSQRTGFENDFFYCYPFLVPFPLFILLPHLYWQKKDISFIILSSITALYICLSYVWLNVYCPFPSLTMRGGESHPRLGE